MGYNSTHRTTTVKQGLQQVTRREIDLIVTAVPSACDVHAFASRVKQNVFKLGCLAVCFPR
jgi:hypothetical protein